MSLFFLFLVFSQIYQTVKLLFNSINPTLFSIITSGIYSRLLMNHVFISDYATNSSVSLGYFETGQIQMWIFVITWSWKSMFDYLIKNKSVKLPFSVLKVSGLSRESLDLLAILNLYAFICPYFIHFCYWLTSASKLNRQVYVFRQVFKTFYISVSTTRKESFSRAHFNFKLRN